MLYGLVTIPESLDSVNLGSIDSLNSTAVNLEYTHKTK